MKDIHQFPSKIESTNTDHFPQKKDKIKKDKSLPVKGDPCLLKRSCLKD